ncbi:hypothetical protein Tco_0458647 [Tanacetum coccineum]
MSSSNTSNIKRAFNPNNTANDGNNSGNDNTGGNPDITAMIGISSVPKEFNGKGGVITYTGLVEKMESVIDVSDCAFNQRVKKIKAMERKIAKKGKFSTNTNLFSRGSNGKRANSKSPFLIIMWFMLLVLVFLAVIQDDEKSPVMVDVARRRILGALLRACCLLISLRKSRGVIRFISNPS